MDKRVVAVVLAVVISASGVAVGAYYYTNSQKSSLSGYYALFFVGLTGGVPSLENWDWTKGPPSWEVIDANAKNLQRSYVTYLKGGVTKGIQPTAPNVSEVIEENLAMKDRINANTYQVRFYYVYAENKTFQALGPEGLDYWKRLVMAEGVLAKRAGYAVALHCALSNGGNLENTTDDIDNFLTKGRDAAVELAELAEKYQFEYFCLHEFDNELHSVTGNITRVYGLLNDSFPEYAQDIRQVFNGKIFTQIALSTFDFTKLNVSSLDFFGVLVQNLGQEVSAVKSMLNQTVTKAETLSSTSGKGWLISECWFGKTHNGNNSDVEYQGDCFSITFDCLENNATIKPIGFLIFSWNFDDPDAFYPAIINTLSETMVKDYFQGK